jgi:hypothetical protein
VPSVSKKQHNLMAAVANNPAFAKKVGIPQSVGRDFSEADKGRKFAKGGDMAKKMFGGKETYAEELKEAKAIKSGRISPQQYARGEQKEEAGMKMKRKFADGGLTTYTNPPQEHPPVPPRGYPPVPPQEYPPVPPMEVASRATPVMNAKSARAAVGARPTVGARMSKGGMAAGKMGKVVAGGKRSHGEHAVQQKGHTKGTMVKMAGGGKAGMKKMNYGGKC